MGDRPRIVTWPDLGLTVLLVAFTLLGTAGAAANQDQTATLPSYVLAVAACLPIAVWRWQPLWTFAGTGAVTMTYLALGYAYGPIMITLAVAVYGFAVRSPIRRGLVGMAALVLAGFVAIGVGVATGDREWTEFVSVAAWLVIPAAVGVAVKVRRDARSDVRAEQARRAISEERLQLAQEVHDVAGHGFAVIAMQAGVALKVLDRDPAGARSALEVIRATSKEALDGLRAEVEALRHGSAEAPLRPTTGLDDLTRLADRIRSSGLPLVVDVENNVDSQDAGRLPEEVDRAAYRIVQESLTNVLRHGGAEATASVRIARAAGLVRVEVVDTGRGSTVPPLHRGGGIDGMRGRAEALGGTLDAGPLAGGGFAVRASLPVAGRPIGDDEPERRWAGGGSA